MTEAQVPVLHVLTGVKVPPVQLAPGQLALAQHVLFTQKPDRHCPPWVQDSPLAWSPTHCWAALQYESGTQSLSSWQVDAQPFPAHWVYGAQDMGEPGWQTPPSQIPTGVTVPAVQLALLQLAPSCPGPVVQTLAWHVVSWQGSDGWEHVSGPQRTVPPQPSSAVPQFVPAGHPRG